MRSGKPSNNPSNKPISKLCIEFDPECFELDERQVKECFIYAPTCGQCPFHNNMEHRLNMGHSEYLSDWKARDEYK